ncbi:cytochrome C [Candidatus Marinarcus aquaticus]|nr:cytochrome C [Candidatus Marinarcus aquaticus]
MNDLENHFGDDASLDEQTHQTILAFLVKNSAESSTKEASLSFLNSIGNKDIIAMTHTSFWKHAHQEVPTTLFAHEKIKSKANCKACHSDVEKGLIEDDKIKNISDFN